MDNLPQTDAPAYPPACQRRWAGRYEFLAYSEQPKQLPADVCRESDKPVLDNGPKSEDKQCT